ncbi:MAG TPA: hypothetical protein VFX59_25560 [Polyangiales bacterium]|nr:hypothetical protein [Polyangiales bacterium]
MIYPYDNETQTRWDRGEFKAQLMQRNTTRPLGFCDGTAEDERELLAQAESEGAEDVKISKRVLKSQREIWTLDAAPE